LEERERARKEVYEHMKNADKKIIRRRGKNRRKEVPKGKGRKTAMEGAPQPTWAQRG